MKNNYLHSATTARRHQAIRELVGGGRVRSQSELAQLLRRRGISVAQPTLSRDVRELGLAKTPAGYAVPDGPRPAVAATGTASARLARALRAFALSVQAAASLVVVKTPPASAQPVARALDESAMPEIAGTIAGDDTVFVATPSERAARELARRLGALAATPERRMPA